jgi:hypothetical protein
LEETTLMRTLFADAVATACALAGAVAVLGVPRLALAEEPPAPPSQAGTQSGSVSGGADTIDLKSGGLLRGTIIDAIPNSYARIQLTTGEVAKVPWGDIARIERAPRPPSSAPSAPPAPPSSTGAGAGAGAGAGSGTIVATMPGKALPSGPPILLHIDGSDGDRLEMKGTGDNDDWSLVCAAPCDRAVPAGYSYRIAGDSIRSSSPFTVDAQQGARQTLVVSEASRGAFVLGIVGLGVGGGGMVVGLFVAFVGAVDVGLSNYGDTNYESGKNVETAGWVTTAVGAAAMAGGLVLLLTNVRTHVSQGGTGSQGASASPPPAPTYSRFATFGEHRLDPMAAAMPPVAGFPVFGTSF